MFIIFCKLNSVMAEGQIYKIHSDFYYVQKDGESFECKIREVLKKQQLKIVVGDFVEFDGGVISKILPKKSYIPRPSVANVDQIVVVSALGKRNKSDHKITDLLFLTGAHLKYGVDAKSVFNIVKERYFEVKKDLNLSIDLEKEFEIIESKFSSNIDEEYLVSRGEYLAAKLMASYLGFTFVDANAFAFCNNLERVTIPEGSVHLGFGAFAGCGKLKDVIIDESVDLADERIFQGCPCLADENGFVIVNNVLYDYCGKDAVINIPDGVTCISNGAFANCDWIKEVKIPDSVSKIGECAFEQCEGMADESGFVIVRDALHGYYGESAVVVVPDGVASISNYAFAFNFNVSEIYIPDSVSYIGEDAFFGCNDITVHASADSYAVEYAEENRMEFICE
jgi:hypothetical protein